MIINSSQGCTATVLLVWADGEDNFFAQCANVGDSACVMKYVFMLSFSIHMIVLIIFPQNLNEC